MNPRDGSDPLNIHQTLGYRTDKLFLKHVPLGLFFILLGLTMLAFSEHNTTEQFVAAWILIAAGLCWTAYALYRRSQPSKPMLELTPSALLFRISDTKQIRIPWREISAVEKVSGSMFFPSLVRPRFLGYEDVTAVRISRAFYDRQIHIPSAFMRGPGWDHTFRVDQKTAQVLFHHDVFDVPPDELRRAIEARWKAFGPQASALASFEVGAPPEDNPAPRAKPSRTVTERRSAGFGITHLWYATKIVVLLAGIVAMLGNIFGYWQTEAQRETRAEHEKWQAEFRKWKEEDKRAAEERRRKDKEWEEFWRKNNF